jgi:hypothetical protein
MTNSENKQTDKQSASIHSKTEIDDDDDTYEKLTLHIDTSQEANAMIEPQPSQNTGSQRMLPTKSATDNWSEHDTQRPEDLRRAQYLTSNYSNNNNHEEGNENDDTKKPKKSKRFENPLTCWTTTSWILTWWAPPFMLKTFGKI